MIDDDLPITYTDDLAAVDWTRLKDDLTADDFDNGRTPDELRRSFENSAVVVFAGTAAASSARPAPCPTGCATPTSWTYGHTATTAAAASPRG